MAHYLDKAGLTYLWGKLKTQFASKADLNRGVEFIRGTQTAATSAWTGVTADSELYDGKKIILFLPYASSSNVTLNLTLAGGSTTGAKNVYYNSTTRMGTQFGQYAQVTLIYHKALVIGTTTYEGWWHEGDYDANTTWQLRLNAAVKGAAACTAGYLILGTSAGYKNVAKGLAFDISYPPLYAGSAISSGGTNTNTFFVIGMTCTASNGGTSPAFTAYKAVYLKGKLSGSTFTVDSSVIFTQAVPTSADGFQYMLLGLAYSATAMYLYPDHPVFEYSNGSFHIHSDSAGGSGSGEDMDFNTKTITFAEDGTVTERNEKNDTIVTAFASDGTITETITINGSTTVITTVFNDDGSITQTKG